MKTIIRINQTITKADLANLEEEISNFEHMSEKSARRVKLALKGQRKKLNRLEASNRMKALNAKRRAEKMKIAA